MEQTGFIFVDHQYIAEYKVIFQIGLSIFVT